MLASRASSAFVCIRCELRSVVPRLRPPHFSTSSRRRDADETTHIEHPPPRPRLSEHPLGRLRKRRGKTALRETTARLGVKTLGDDAKILVLKEVGEAPLANNVIPNIVSAPPHEIPDIVKALLEENRPVTPDEVVKQLEKLRPITHADPNGPHYVGQSTFIKLSGALLQGFTGQQLSHYYSVTKGVKKHDVNKEVFDGLKQLQSKAERPAVRSDWHPGTTSIDLRLPGLDIHKKTKRKPISKHLLVDQILRDVWKLVLLEEIESPGELELSLKSWQLSLLASGSPTPLDQIRKDRKARLEIFWPHHVLRITADKNTAEYAANDLEQILEHVETKQFHLAPWIPYMGAPPTDLINICSEKNLQAISKLTGANVQLASGRTVIIRALNKNAAEEAERCFIRMLPLKLTISHTIDTTQRDAGTDQSYLLPIAFEKSSLNMQLREQELGRWSFPIPRGSVLKCEGEDTSTTNAVKDQISENTRERALEMLMKSRQSIIDARLKNGLLTGQWTADPEVKLSATFGQLLFPLDSAQQSHSFLSTVPGLTNILTDDDFTVKRGLNLPALEYTFVAAPRQSSLQNGQTYPQFCIQFRHNNRTGKHFPWKASLTFDERIHDVLLPDELVDLRLRMHTSLRLNIPDADEKVASFKNSILANIQSGERLTAPSLEINIPSWVIPDRTHASGPGTQSVKYLFTGIRFRQSVAATYHNVDMGYSTTQSGKMDGRSASLSAFFIDNGDTSGDREAGLDERKLEEYVKNCLQIVKKITKAANRDQPRSSLMKSRDFPSARGLRGQNIQTPP